VLRGKKEQDERGIKETEQDDRCVKGKNRMTAEFRGRTG
jgi:hypothetical protein